MTVFFNGVELSTPEQIAAALRIHVELAELRRELERGEQPDLARGPDPIWSAIARATAA